MISWRAVADAIPWYSKGVADQVSQVSDKGERWKSVSVYIEGNGEEGVCDRRGEEARYSTPFAVNDSRVSVMYGRATWTSVTVVSKFPTKTWGAAHARTVDTRCSFLQLPSAWERG